MHQNIMNHLMLDLYRCLNLWAFSKHLNLSFIDTKFQIKIKLVFNPIFIKLINVFVINIILFFLYVINKEIWWDIIFETLVLENKDPRYFQSFKEIYWFEMTLSERRDDRCRKIHWHYGTDIMTIWERSEQNSKFNVSLVTLKILIMFLFFIYKQHHY